MRQLRIEAEFICRVAGEPVTRITCLRSRKLEKLLQRYFKAHRAADAARVAASEALYRSVPRLTKAQRHLAIKLRRDVFAGREVSPSDSLALSDALSRRSLAKVNSALRWSKQLKQLESEIAPVYAAEQIRSARSLWRETARSDVASGLVLSSEQLAIQFMDGADAIASKARRGQVERGMLRYLTRAATKPTPFSTFCTVIQGQLVTPGSDVHTGFIDGSLRKVSSIRLNRALFPALWNELLTVEEFQQAVKLHTAPSLHTRDGWYAFLQERDGVEISQKVHSNPAIDSLVQQLDSGGPTRFRDLVKHLVGDVNTEEENEEAARYLERLIEVGLLQYWTGIDPLDPVWNLQLMEMLEAAHPTIKSAKSALSRLQRCVQTYPRKRPAGRLAAVRLARNTIDSFFRHRSKQIRLPGNLPFYEDCGANAQAVLPLPSSTGWPGTLEELLTLFRALSSQWDEQATLRAVYHHCYGAESHEPVPLMQFYEDAFREFYKRHFAIERGQRTEEDEDYSLSNPFELQSVSLRAGSRTAVTASIRQKLDSMHDADTINMSVADFRSCIDLDQADPMPVSISVFCHLQEGLDGKQMLIMPDAKTSPGFGKYYSRFLHVVPETFQQAVRQRNLEFGDGLAETSDDSDFNANLRPRLIGREIIYPTSSAASPVRDRIKCEDLVVVPADEFEGLKLAHREGGATLIPLDLGFLNPTMRPAFHRLLQKFQPACFTWIPVEQCLYALALDTWKNARKDNADCELPVVETPRIVVDGTIVIARRRWRVAADNLPSQLKGEDDTSYFLRLQHWRNENRVPARVFVRAAPRLVAPVSESDSGNQKPGSQVRLRDHRKPQYVDFSSPVLVVLFARILATVRQADIIIEEALPDPDDGWLCGKERYLTEMVIQLSNQEV